MVAISFQQNSDKSESFMKYSFRNYSQISKENVSGARRGKTQHWAVTRVLTSPNESNQTPCL